MKLCCADPLIECQQVELFTMGLQEAMLTDVELQAPHNLDMAVSLARAYEHRLQFTAPPTWFFPHRATDPRVGGVQGKPAVSPVLVGASS